MTTHEQGTIENGEFVKLFATFNQDDVALVESLFQANGIAYFTIGGNVHYGPVVFMVNGAHAADAQGLLRGVDLKLHKF